LLDVKILGAYEAADTYGGGWRVIYLLQDSTGHFTKISFFDKQALPERNIDGDSIFVAVTASFQHFEHSYWVYNLYKFAKDGLVDVSEKHGYPIFVQELYKENHKLAHNKPLEVRRKFILAEPPEYEKDRGIIYSNE